MSVSFPKPLSEKEERYYIQAYEDGDEEAKSMLIERNLRLVAHIAKKYTSQFHTMDDFISIGTIGRHQGRQYLQQQPLDTSCYLCCQMHRERDPHVHKSITEKLLRGFP